MLDETPSEVEQVRLENLDLRLRNIERQLEVVATLACPVCRPALVAQLHPDSDWHDHAEWSVVKANGAHGK